MEACIADLERLPGQNEFKPGAIDDQDSATTMRNHHEIATRYLSNIFQRAPRNIYYNFVKQDA